MNDIHLPDLDGRCRPPVQLPTWVGGMLPSGALQILWNSGIFTQAVLAGITGFCPKHCIRCAEAVWWKCHRSLIADAPKLRGWKEMHILPLKKQKNIHFPLPQGSGLADCFMISCHGKEDKEGKSNRPVHSPDPQFPV
ncbi:MAG TPA: hypothetical protein VNE41_05350 [Chitinophagaceae bacterium]|nr:hypothetical protein [Chitinophagaceae bacterium]